MAKQDLPVVHRLSERNAVDGLSLDQLPQFGPALV